MKKDQNRSSVNTRCFSLPRSKILRGKRNFQLLFKQSSVLHTPSLQFRYRLLNTHANEIQTGFIAPKRIMKKAVSRNKAKRWLRESYRTHQHILTDYFSARPGGVHGVFIIKNENVTYGEIEREVQQLLSALVEKAGSQRKRIEQKAPSTSHKII